MIGDVGRVLIGEEFDMSLILILILKKFYVLFVVNVVLLSGVLCLLVFYIVWLNNVYKDDF